MRKITKEAAMAFASSKSFKLSNTEVCQSFGGHNSLFLHNNMIAWEERGNTVFFSLCGWNTNTTRERLNGLFDTLDIGTRIVSRNGKAYAIDLYDRFPSSMMQEIDVDGKYDAMTWERIA